MTISAAVDLAPEQYRGPLMQVMDDYGITNRIEFLATVFYESEYLTVFEENLNYSVEALLKKFSRKRISYEAAMALGRTSRQRAQKEAIANEIYGGTFGRENLGNYIQGDGWHYRGQGPIQLTGRDAWEQFGKHVGRSDIGQNPFIALRDPLLTCQTSGFFWTKYKNINPCGSDMRAVTKKVTGAADTAIKTRVAIRDRIKKLVEAA